MQGQPHVLWLVPIVSILAHSKHSLCKPYNHHNPCSLYCHLRAGAYRCGVHATSPMLHLQTKEPAVPLGAAPSALARPQGNTTDGRLLPAAGHAVYPIFLVLRRGPQSTPLCSHAFTPRLIVQCTHRRIGEASHPGPHLKERTELWPCAAGYDLIFIPGDGQCLYPALGFHVTPSPSCWY